MLKNVEGIKQFMDQRVRENQELLICVQFSTVGVEARWQTEPNLLTREDGNLGCIPQFEVHPRIHWHSFHL